MLSAALALSLQCASLFGSYDSIDPRANFLRIHGDTEKVKLVFDRAKNRYEETYLTDGSSHEGDGDRTGLSYTAICKDQKLIITKKVEGVDEPVRQDYTLNEKTLTVTITIGEHQREQAVFTKR